MTPKVATIDFETEAIQARPNYPPRPVGVSIKPPGKASKYYAWGHLSENNCLKSDALKALQGVYTKYPILCHNAKFDLDVARTHFGLKFPKYGYHETMFLAFLHDPHSHNLKLKSLASQLLRVDTDEQDVLHKWIANFVYTSLAGAQGHVKISTSRPKNYHKIPKSKLGMFICKAPGRLVGKYAKADTDMTVGLFKLLYAYCSERGMLGAYEREQKLMPILLQSEISGVRVSENLYTDHLEWGTWIDECDEWIRKRLKAPYLSVDKSQQVADALEAAGIVSPDEWVFTEPTARHPEGQRSTAKDNLLECVKDPEILQVMSYRARITNTYRNFAKPWVKTMRLSGGFIHTNWNQVRGNDAGARTGRLSSNPNFQNILNKKVPVIFSGTNPPKDSKGFVVKHITLPESLEGKVRELPFLRNYIIPDNAGDCLLNRDYMQQEIRILAHFEDAVLLDAFIKDPYLDIHDKALTLVNAMLGTNLGRQVIKALGFGLIYGMGIDLLSKNMGVDVPLGAEIKDAYLKSFPGLGTLTRDLKNRASVGLPIHTWGGREYYVEPSRVVKGKLRTFAYKLLNVLVQGSAADCSKQAIINYDSVKKEGNLLLSVHDELMINCPNGARVTEMKLLREAMEGVNFDVKMLTDGKYGTTSWGEMEKVAWG